MFSHVVLGTDNVEKSKVFYDAILGALGYGEGVINAKGMCMYMTDSGVLGLTHPINGEPASYGNGMTVGFSASSAEQVNAWYQAGLASGGVACEEPPGERNAGPVTLYLAYLRDPTGNKICAAHMIK
jgi:catechol 2,3-dioxygenase-like lactoylglutathione lyase family enzyme